MGNIYVYMLQSVFMKFLMKTNTIQDTIHQSDKLNATDLCHMTRPILDIGDIGALLETHFMERRTFHLFASCKQMPLLIVYIENIFS